MKNTALATLAAVDNFLTIKFLLFALFIWFIGMTISFGLTALETEKYKMIKKDLKIMYISIFILKNIFIWPWVIGYKIGKFIDKF